MKDFIALFFLALLLLFVQETSCSFKERKQAEFEEKLQQISVSSCHGSSCHTHRSLGKKTGRVFYPIKYGADPTGLHDSSDAILNALKDAFRVQDGLELLPGVNDLGGAVVDLQGGNYKISKPIRFPASGGGNVVVQAGTFRASDKFPVDRHLVELWSPDSQVLEKTASIRPENFNQMKVQKTNVGIYYEDITFRDILFDSVYRGGGIFIIDSARIRIDNCFFIHFTTEGILVQKGHETFISSCFLGQHLTIGGDKGEINFTGTAIDLASNDNAITDVAIFSAAIGILLRGQANILTGVHCYNKATFWGGIGILVKSDGYLTRIDNCYLDYTAIVMEDPVQVHVTNGFFLGDGNVVLKAINGSISGVTIVDNMFRGSNNSIPIVKLDGNFTSIDQVVIDHNNVNGMSLKSTVGKLTVAGNGTKWVADFSSLLVFPDLINHFHYSFQYQGLPQVFPAHGATDISNNLVVVESDKAVNGVVSVFVDQYNAAGESNFLV